MIPRCLVFDSDSFRENFAETDFHSFYDRQHDEREIENNFHAADERTSKKQARDPSKGHHQVKSTESYVGSIFYNICTLIVEIDRDVVTLTVK